VYERVAQSDGLLPPAVLRLPRLVRSLDEIEELREAVRVGLAALLQQREHEAVIDDEPAHERLRLLRDEAIEGLAIPVLVATVGLLLAHELLLVLLARADRPPRVACSR
jgi:hypothetical protein